MQIHFTEKNEHTKTGGSYYVKHYTEAECINCGTQATTEIITKAKASSENHQSSITEKTTESTQPNSHYTECANSGTQATTEIITENPSHHYSINAQQAARLLGVTSQTLTHVLMIHFPDELPCLETPKITGKYRAYLFRKADIKAFVNNRLHGRKPDEEWRYYTLSANRAAKMLNIGATRFESCLLRYPEQLPYVDYTTNSRRIIRFCEEDIKRFARQNGIPLSHDQ